MKRPSVILLLALAACGKTASVPIASGSPDAVRNAATAARGCGITKLRVDPLDDHTAMLLVDPKTPPAALACTRDWLRTRPDLQPAHH